MHQMSSQIARMLHITVKYNSGENANNRITQYSVTNCDSHIWIFAPPILPISYQFLVLHCVNLFRRGMNFVFWNLGILRLNRLTSFEKYTVDFFSSKRLQKCIHSVTNMADYSPVWLEKKCMLYVRFFAYFLRWVYFFCRQSLEIDGQQINDKNFWQKF